MLNVDQLRVAVEAAKCKFDLLAKKYPAMKARLPNGNSTSVLVFSSPAGQAGIGITPTDLLSLFPEMLVDDDAKTQALNLQGRLKALEPEAANDDETERLREQLYQLVSKLKYHGQCQVELRFNRLDYDLIWKLQVDELVDRDLSPQNKASIRIVLGRLARLAQE